MCCPHRRFNIFFDAALEVDILRFSEDEEISENLVQHLN